ncbi:M23 family metallopeptidase, partial [Agathobaculum sp.]|uniref:M23 family metallopeptidase n=1 Tax=Agathobaculum sp. TaxID=2048138 RepID=UPI003A8D30C3
SMEAVGKRWIASLPSLVDTSRQVSANVEESRQNEEYRQLEEQEQTLELTLQGMNSTAADGSVPADYQAVYDQLQEVRKRKNELTVNKGVDPNKWSQRMLREANEAQANAEAGLAPAPRWLTEQGISLAGNAPVMAASAIPVVGPAVGSIMMGGQAAGQRSFELNEQGKGARESLTRGLTSGAIEAATERLPLGQMSKILHSGGVNAVKNILIQMGEEATEESASYFLNYVADKAAQDSDAKFSLQELAQSAAGGAFGGLVFGAAGAVTSRGVYGSPTENQLTNRPMAEYEVQADTPYLQVERFTEPLTQTMVKIDEQMRKAETLPEGTIKQQYTAALQEDAQRVSKQLSILENNRAELMQARNIAERFGAKFELADLGPAGGKYENGTITVNPYSSSPVRQVLVHELTHHLENSGSYNALQEMALHLFTQEQGVSADVLRDNITRMYAEQGVTLDTQAANRELTAAFCEKRLFQDDASIQRLAQTDVSLFQRIRQWIADTVIRLRGTKEQQQLLELQRRYEKAARTVGAVQDRGAQYKIETLPDGKQYVKSDRQVIEGDDASAWSKQAEQFINEKIRNNADLRVFTKDGFAIDITERSAYKLSDPHVQSIEKVARPMLGREALKAKMQAAGHIDELAETARWSKFAPDRNGKHAYDIGEDGFDTFTTYFEDSDGQYYRVRFTAGVNEDMDTAYSIGQMDKRNHPSSAGSSSAPFGRGAQNTRMVYDNSITPDGANDNTSGTKFKGLALQREYRQAVESGNMERAREILAEKAARRGYLSYDTTADAQNHIIQNANPVEDDYHTWIRNAGDVHSFAEVLNDSDWNGMDFDPDYTWDMAQKALQTGEITVYSSYPIGTLGGFVTPSRMEAEGYAGNGEVYSKTVNLDDIAWIDPTQGQYAPTQNGSIYKQGSPYAKIPDVTYDDNGKLIPLSQRYDDSRTDSRYTLGFTPEQIAKGTVPLADAMQYGKTPEQAVMEANARAEGERTRNGYEKNRKSFSNQAAPETTSAQMNLSAERFSANEGSKIPIAPNDVSGSTQGTASMIPQGETMSFMTGTKMGYPSDTVSPDGSDIPSVGNSISPNAENGNTSTENVPLTNAMQYGKTPEQAVMEARTRAEGERVRQAREEQAAAEQQERLDRITNGKNRDIMQRVYEAQERAERVASRHALERATTRATASDADSYIDHTQEDIAIDLVNSLESERRFLTNLRNGWHLSDAELVNAERMAAGRGPVTEMDSHRYELVETYARAMRQYNEDMQPYYAFQRGLDDARLRRATELIKDSDNWKDSRGNLGLQIHTPERVLRKVMGDTAETEAIYQAYFAPVLKHDAEAIRWENTQRERLKGIMEGLSHEDSVYIHMKNRAELSPKNEAMQKQLSDYVKENKSKIHFKQAESAIQKLYEMTSEMHPQVSEAGVRNGYAPLEFRQKYIPSLTPTKEGKWYNRILRKVGVETMMDELPTEIAGRTEDRRPGRQYAGFYNQREGINTEFDAFKAMDNYISGASNAIFHTDDIQNLRVLEDAIRSKYSDEGSRAELEAIRKDPDINIEDKEQKISKIWERNSGTLPSFPSWIAEYTNILAGKKSRTDRSAEQMFGRGLYRAMSDIEGKVAANMVGGNLSTAISNFIPLAQGSGEVRYSSMMRAMLDYGADLAKKNPAFHEDSDFLTNRRGSERVIKTKLQKASDAAGWTMNAIDNLSSEVMVRARYLDNVEKRHMSTEAALQEADRWAAGLIGDRARGAKPVIMESKSPLIKAFTMFQLEVMNQYDHLFGDIPHNLRTQGRSKAQIAAGTAAALLQVFVMSHLFNDAREKLTGSRGAFDPIEMVNDFVGRLTGYALPNIFDLLGEMMGDGIDEDDFRAEKSETAWDNVTATAQDIASNIPFVSGPLGSLAGAGNSRLPIQSVIPSIANIATAQGEDARSMAVIKELSKPLYGFLLPFGGLQAKKTVEGAATMFAGGSYSYDKKGEKILQFPTYGQKPADWAQALLFGKSSSDEARAWRESGYETLNAEETKVFDTLSKSADNDPEARKNIYDAIMALHDVQSDTDENGQLLDNEGEKKRRMLFENDKLTQSQKTAIDRDIIVNTVGGSTADYSDRTSFEISTEVRKKMQGAAHKAADAGLAVSTFAKYDNTLKELTEGTDENGEKLHTEDEARGMVLDAIQQDSSLTDGEKQTLADYLLVSSMSEKARETWNDEVKGKVNASDYVRFKSDVAAYEAEFEGTGADHAANVANILNSYTNLTDEQKSVLMNTYNDTAKNDVFHISEYEKSLTDNSYYKSLNDSEKSKLRAYCNEYEQAISAGKELSGWKAKAYMAKEAGIEPGTYALFQTALSLINSDGGNAKNEEITQAVKLVPGLTDSQKAYLWQAAYGKESTKSNPWGGATVTKYQKGENKAVNPVDGGTLSDGFGWRTAPTTGASNNHKAIDIAAPQGTPVKAAMSGKIVGMNKYGYGKDEYEGYGVSVTVDCGNGITMAYHHMVDGSNANLNIGDEVKAGQQIGQVGSTGISTGPHLDFQVVKDGKYVDPRNYIPGYGEGTSETISAAQAAVAASSGKKSGKSHKSGGSGKSGGSSGGLKQPKRLSGLKGLGF